MLGELLFSSSFVLVCHLASTTPTFITAKGIFFSFPGGLKHSNLIKNKHILVQIIRFLCSFGSVIIKQDMIIIPFYKLVNPFVKDIYFIHPV